MFQAAGIMHQAISMGIVGSAWLIPRIFFAVLRGEGLPIDNKLAIVAVGHTSASA
jgi:hypothetical protein